MFQTHPLGLVPPAAQPPLVGETQPPCGSAAAAISQPPKLFVSAWTRRDTLLRLSFLRCSFPLSPHFPYLFFFVRPARCCNKQEIIYVLAPWQKMRAPCGGYWGKKAEVCVYVRTDRWTRRSKCTHDLLFTLHQSVLDVLFFFDLHSLANRCQVTKAKVLKVPLCGICLPLPASKISNSEKCLGRLIILTRSRMTYLSTQRPYCQSGDHCTFFLAQSAA